MRQHLWQVSDNLRATLAEMERLATRRASIVSQGELESAAESARNAELSDIQQRIEAVDVLVIQAQALCNDQLSPLRRRFFLLPNSKKAVNATTTTGL